MLHPSHLVELMELDQDGHLMRPKCFPLRNRSNGHWCFFLSVYAVVVHDALELGNCKTITKFLAIIYVYNELELQIYCRNQVLLL